MVAKNEMSLSMLMVYCRASTCLPTMQWSLSLQCGETEVDPAPTQSDEA